MVIIPNSRGTNPSPYEKIIPIPQEYSSKIESLTEAKYIDGAINITMPKISHTIPNTEIFCSASNIFFDLAKIKVIVRIIKHITINVIAVLPAFTILSSARMPESVVPPEPAK
ncbi:MAG: hypothetical protein ACFFA0_15905 [Promethearchaeota archaeon]